MNVELLDGSLRCCPAPGGEHTTRCFALHNKWVLRRDRYSDDPARPYTVWRHNRDDTMFYAWGAFARHDNALFYVETLTRKYRTRPEEHP